MACTAFTGDNRGCTSQRHPIVRGAHKLRRRGWPARVTKIWEGKRYSIAAGPYGFLRAVRAVNTPQTWTNCWRPGRGDDLQELVDVVQGGIDLTVPDSSEGEMCVSRWSTA